MPVTISCSNQSLLFSPSLLLLFKPKTVQNIVPYYNIYFPKVISYNNRFNCQHDALSSGQINYNSISSNMLNLQQESTTAIVRQFPVLCCARLLSWDSCYVEIHVAGCIQECHACLRYNFKLSTGCRNMFSRLIKQKETLAYKCTYTWCRNMFSRLIKQKETLAYKCTYTCLLV